MSQSAITLYSYFRSSCSFRVRIVLQYLGIAYDYQGVHLVKEGGQQFSTAFRNKNPMAQVPYLEVGGFGISQSMAIIEYLHSLKPEREVIPRDLQKAAQVREFCEHINSGIQPLQNLATLKKLEMLLNIDSDMRLQWSREIIVTGFQALEAKLVDNSVFCFEHFTAADAFLVPQVYNAHRFQVDMDAFPKIRRIYEHCQQLDYFQLAWPEQQPDAASSIN